MRLKLDSFRFALILLAIPTLASAQMVRGTVSDATSGVAIKSANLSLYTTEGRRLLRGVSDEEGKFELVLPKGVTVYLQAERIGYATVKSAPITARTSELLQLNVRLSAEAVPVQGIEVVARRTVEPRLQPFLDRASLYKRAGIGHVWTRKELEQRHPALVSHIINHWTISRKPFNCSGERIFIDDFPVDPDDVDLLVEPDQLEGVELYNDTNIPPDLLMKAQSVSGGGVGISDGTPPCKTVMLWRKPYAELNAQPRPRAPLWRVLAGAAALVGLIAAEQVLIGN